MKKLMKRPQQGFTLIEILIVIGIIAILAAIVLVAINPARQFRQANNTQRESNVNAILNAVGQYIIDQQGRVATSTFSNSVRTIGNGSGQSDLCSILVPTYMTALPIDPSLGGGSVTNCGANYDTGYTIQSSTTISRITIAAPLAVDVNSGIASSTLISVTR